VTSPPDEDLVRRCLDGDEGAFEALFRRYEPIVRRLLTHATGDAEVVDDLCQEVFLKVFRNVSRFRFRASIKTWIYRVAVNVAIDFSRGSARRRLAEPEPDWDRVPARGPDPAEEAARRELRALVRRYMMELKPKLRTTLVLREIHGLGYAEIAQVMRCPIRTVETRLRRAREQILARMAPTWPMLDEE